MPGRCSCGHGYSQHRERGPCDYDGHACECKKYGKGRPYRLTRAADGSYNVEKATTEHDTKPRPHGIACAACLRLGVCNECGRATSASEGRCTNGRCRRCCPMVCKHRAY